MMQSYECMIPSWIMDEERMAVMSEVCYNVLQCVAVCCIVSDHG